VNLDPSDGLRWLIRQPRVETGDQSGAEIDA
jgi:hypothetical protein